MFYVFKILVYRGTDILLVKQENDEKIYIPRNCVRKALKYNNSSQLSKMQLRYQNVFKKEYIREFSLRGSNGDVVNKVGLYTIRGVIEVCSHTQKFRGSDVF